MLEKRPGSIAPGLPVARVGTGVRPACSPDWSQDGTDEAQRERITGSARPVVLTESGTSPQGATRADHKRRLSSGRRGAEVRLEAATMGSADAGAASDITATSIVAFLNRSSSRKEPPAD